MSDGNLFDKVVEFGMGMAVAQQIPKMMNVANEGASQVAPPPIPQATAYFLAIGGKQYGPFTVQQLQPFVPTGQITPETLVWCQGMTGWQPANSRPDIALLFAK